MCDAFECMISVRLLLLCHGGKQYCEHPISFSKLPENPVQAAARAAGLHPNNSNGNALSQDPAMSESVSSVDVFAKHGIERVRLHCHELSVCSVLKCVCNFLLPCH